MSTWKLTAMGLLLGVALLGTGCSQHSRWMGHWLNPHYRTLAIVLIVVLFVLFLNALRKPR